MHCVKQLIIHALVNNTTITCVLSDIEVITHHNVNVCDQIQSNFFSIQLGQTSARKILLTCTSLKKVKYIERFKPFIKTINTSTTNNVIW